MVGRRHHGTGSARYASEGR